MTHHNDSPLLNDVRKAEQHLRHLLTLGLGDECANLLDQAEDAAAMTEEPGGYASADWEHDDGSLINGWVVAAGYGGRLQVEAEVGLWGRNLETAQAGLRLTIIGTADLGLLYGDLVQMRTLLPASCAPETQQWLEQRENEVRRLLSRTRVRHERWLRDALGRAGA